MIVIETMPLVYLTSVLWSLRRESGFIPLLELDNLPSLDGHISSLMLFSSSLVASVKIKAWLDTFCTVSFLWEVNKNKSI